LANRKIQLLKDGLNGWTKGGKFAAQSPILVPPLALPQAVQGSFYHFHSQRLLYTWSKYIVSVSPPLALHRLINFSSTCSESVDDISLWFHDPWSCFQVPM
jgi:hypothetical protein